jgi:uncharacterized membrane protein YkvA (DUF1232 family)
MPKKGKSIAAKIKTEIKVYRFVLKDKRTPWPARMLLAAAVGYLLLPFDIIPDFIPVLGQLDDLIIVPLLVMLALKMIPAQIVRDCRAQAQEPSLLINYP